MNFESGISVTPLYIQEIVTDTLPLGSGISVTGNYETFRDMSRIPGASA
jgi:hypothetical protein